MRFVETKIKLKKRSYDMQLKNVKRLCNLLKTTTVKQCAQVYITEAGTCCALGVYLTEVYGDIKPLDLLTKCSPYSVFQILQLNLGLSPSEWLKITDWNDSGKSFKEIAALIEEHLIDEEPIESSPSVIVEGSVYQPTDVYA